MARARALKPVGGNPGSGKVVGPHGETVEVRFLDNDTIIVRVYLPGQLAILNSFTGKNNDYSNLTLQMLSLGSPSDT